MTAPLKPRGKSSRVCAETNPEGETPDRWQRLQKPVIVKR